MLLTTDAIVLALTPHSDRAMLLSVYTRHRGRQNYLVYGVGSRKQRKAVFTPLSRVSLSIDEQPTRPIQTLRDIQFRVVPEQSVSDIRRQTVALFVAEVLFRTIRHPMEDESLFELIDTTAEAIEHDPHPENVHIDFLREFCTVIGFALDEEQHAALLQTPTTHAERRQTLLGLCNYLHEHVEDWVQPKSLDVLMTVFD